MIETEVKLKLPRGMTIELVEQKLDLHFQQAEEQEDRIFAENEEVILNLLEGSRIFRFRKTKKNVSVTLKSIITSIPLVRDEVSFDTHEQKNFEQLFKFIGMNEVVSVRKIRSMSNEGDWNLYFDEVRNLGNFLEVELLTEAPPSYSITDDPRFARLLQNLGIDSSAIVHDPYDKMLLEK